MSNGMGNANYIELTAEIVSAYLSHNTVPAGDIPGLINKTSPAVGL